MELLPVGVRPTARHAHQYPSYLCAQKRRLETASIVTSQWFIHIACNCAMTCSLVATCPWLLSVISVKEIVTVRLNPICFGNHLLERPSEGLRGYILQNEQFLKFSWQSTLKSRLNGLGIPLQKMADFEPRFHKRHGEALCHCQQTGQGMDPLPLTCLVKFRKNGPLRGP